MKPLILVAFGAVIGLAAVAVGANSNGVCLSGFYRLSDDDVLALAINDFSADRAASVQAEMQALSGPVSAQTYVLDVGNCCQIVSDQESRDSGPVSITSKVLGEVRAVVKISAPEIFGAKMASNLQNIKYYYVSNCGTVGTYNELYS